MAKTRHTSVLLLLLGVAAGQSSAPHCSLKGCFSSVFTSLSSVARSDCQSYFRVTKSPCPVPETTTVTAPPSTFTVTAKSTLYTKTVYDISTTVQTSFATVTTVISTVSSTELDTVSIYNTKTMTALDSTVATVSTTSSIITDVVQPAPSSAPQPSSFPAKRNLFARGGCTPVTYAPTAIPTYASACGANPGNVQYYSACSCFGATPTTTTLPASTVIVSTVTVTPKVTVTTTVPVSGGKRALTLTTTLSYQTSVTSTSSQTLTSATTTIVTTVTSAVETDTISATSTSSTTQLVIETGCPLVAVNGDVNGQHLVLSTGPFKFTPDPTKADLFFMKGDGLYVSPDDTFSPYATHPITPGAALPILFDSRPDGYVVFDGSVYQNDDPYYPALCQLNQDNTLTCVGTDGAAKINSFCTYHFSSGEYLLTACPSNWADPITLAFNCNG